MCRTKPVVAVFGATGYTGRFVIAELLRRGVAAAATAMPSRRHRHAKRSSVSSKANTVPRVLTRPAKYSMPKTFWQHSDPKILHSKSQRVDCSLLLEMATRGAARQPMRASVSPTRRKT
jgi:short subunit dehydrogenase-like uncharacterized protein